MLVVICVILQLKTCFTGSFVRYAAFMMNLIICLLYIAEATYIDELLKREEDIVIECLNKTLSNYSELSVYVKIENMCSFTNHLSIHCSMCPFLYIELI